MKTFNLPDLGEGLAESEIVKWHINVGDMVKLDQVVLTVETAKAPSMSLLPTAVE
ncbi:dihydrolipoamide acyltransferase component of branched-chain alpha-keto acid dehydrogenase complex [Vibrio ponticus]|nr:dihydrolipoamide acyltransferase component of branched-chain alpha-keto acid dehydrogenase complex [Vibrio ponticus]